MSIIKPVILSDSSLVCYSSFNFTFLFVGLIALDPGWCGILPQAGMCLILWLQHAFSVYPRERQACFYYLCKGVGFNLIVSDEVCFVPDLANLEK